MAAEQPTEEDLVRLQRLLWGGESESIEALRQRVEDPERRAEDVASVLPTAIRDSHKAGPGLGDALQTPFEGGLFRVIRERPERVSEALFPVMGPAIRRAIAEALKGLAQQISHTLDTSLTPKGLRWRMEARRAGVPLGEYVLRKTLKYRVEQAFLINRVNGLLVSHAQLPQVRGVDEDAVSGMFTAIQDFIRDAFSAQGEEGALQTADLGDVTLWAVRGPFSHLVVVIRGVAPRRIRDDLAAILESINLQFADELRDFDGDSSPLNRLHAEVERCLLLQDLSPTEGRETRRRVPWIGLLTLLFALVVGWWLWSSYQRNAALDIYRDRLKAAPGYAATNVTTRQGSLWVTGLRDPLAAPLAQVLRLPAGQANGEFSPYLSLEPELVLRRAEARLRPPSSVELRYEGGLLAVTGSASGEWIAALEASAMAVPGVEILDAKGLTVDTDAKQALRQAAQALSGNRIVFPEGAVLTEQAILDLRSLADGIVDLGRRSEVEGLIPSIVVTGFADAIGSSATNESLKSARAAAVATQLVEAGVDASWVKTAAGASLGTGTVPEHQFRYAEVQVNLVDGSVP